MTSAVIEGLDRSRLAVLGREWLLHGHLQDRVAMALVLERADRETMQEIAIEEWMAASPIYSQRMRRAMRFDGDGVEPIMKNLQLDVGAPHQFMDFRYRLTDPDHGEFWLAHCGALMDVEPMGEKYVHGMCHAIEDPTFDATAAAANPLAAVRPIHRPPRVPSDRTPHCHWRIDITADGDPVEPHPNQELLAASLLAQLPVVAPEASDDGGWADYAGEFDPDFCLEDLSRPALIAALDEFAIQSLLLLRGFAIAAGQRFGPDVVDDFLPRLVAGWCGLTAQRIRDAFALPPSAQGIADLVGLHPMFAPAAYLDVRVEVIDDHRLRIALGDCAAAREADRFHWVAHLGAEPMAETMTGALGSVISAFNPQAGLALLAPTGDEVHAFMVTIDPDASPAREVGELAIAKISTGAAFRFERRRPVRV